MIGTLTSGCKEQSTEKRGSIKSKKISVIPRLSAFHLKKMFFADRHRTGT
jgi:hypothetical protein